MASALLISAFVLPQGFVSSQKQAPGHLAFASLMASLTGKQKVSEPTCNHEPDLQKLFAEIDTDADGFLDGPLSQ